MRDLIDKVKTEIIKVVDKRKLEVDNSIRDIKNGMGKAGLKAGNEKKVSGMPKRPQQSSDQAEPLSPAKKRIGGQSQRSKDSDIASEANGTF